MAPPAAGTERPDEQMGREFVAQLTRGGRSSLNGGTSGVRLLMAITKKSARLETSTGAVSHPPVGEGDVPRTLAQGMEEQKRAAFLDSVPPLSRGLIARSLASSASPRAGNQGLLPRLHPLQPRRDHPLSGLALSAACLSPPLALGAR
jgi:hypothetical protein